MSALLRRIDRRLRDESRRALLRVFGRPIVCAACGRTIFRAIPVVRNGRLKLIGAARPQHNVHIEFEEPQVLRFRHVELDRCPSPERPWVH